MALGRTVVTGAGTRAGTRAWTRARASVPSPGVLPSATLARLCAAHIDGRGPARRTALRARLGSVLTALDVRVPDATGDRLAAVAGLLTLAGQVAPGRAGDTQDHRTQDRRKQDGGGVAVRQDLVWLVTAVVTGRLPDRAEVLRRSRQLALDGPWAVLHSLLSRMVHRSGSPWPTVGVVTGVVLVDVHHTAQTDLATGIQRVARRTTAEWAQRHPEVVLVGWTSRLDALRPLPAAERARALGVRSGAGPSGAGPPSAGPPSAGPPNAGPPSAETGGAHERGGQEATCAVPDCGRGRGDEGGGDRPAVPAPKHPLPDVVVPWGSTYLLPELMTEGPRTDRLQALLRHSRGRSGLIAFDMVPISSAETTADSMGPAFAGMLTAAAHAGAVAAISGAAADEWRGWRRMLTGTGLTGPEVTAVSLPTEPVAADDDDTLAQASAELLVRDDDGALPMVLCVGSHEPRKNHGAVLAAAETLWRGGLRFSLLMVGGNAWHSERFTAAASVLQQAGRPLLLRSALPDPELWAAYRLARCTVFPSYAEGFGLPVAESLAVGTPALTSAYGSMREIAEDGGGALLVDPRDDASVTDGLRRLLTDDDLHAELSAQAGARPAKTWADYADRVWQVLVGAE